MKAKSCCGSWSVDMAKTFEELLAVQNLKKLSATPYDLTKPGALSPDRIENFQAEACEFKLLYAMERVDESVLNELEALAKETQAVDKMKQMQRGEVLNHIEGYPCENRAVMHTATRDVFNSEPTLAETKTAKMELINLESFDKKVFAKGNFTDLIMVGIGGSDLGPRAIFYALEKWQLPERRVHFIANVDPDDPAKVLEEVNLKKAVVVVVSKSGTTLETLTNETFLRNAYEKEGLDPSRHFIAVTMAKSPMDDTSRYLACFHIWDTIGGRYSSTSMVGGVMLTFALGYERFREFLQGANEMDQHALEPDPRKNLPLMSALLGIWNRNFLGYPTVAVIPYSQALWRFPAHLQQCDMESNGKQIDKFGRPVKFQTGPIVWGEPGTNGQHSFFQLLHQGTSPVPVEFIGFKESQRGVDVEVKGTTSQQKLLANLLAQMLALAQGKKSDNPNKNFPGNRPSRLLFSDQLTPKVMGSLLAFYEHKVAFQGFMWNINSFDQEGVQLGKLLADRFLDLFKGKISEKDFPEGAALWKELQ